MEHQQSGKPVIQVSHLSKIYKVAHGQFTALDDVSFSVYEGERVGIVGSNGAGKSTLLAILSEFAGASGGSVEIQGRVNAILDVGSSIQPEMTGRENLRVGGRMQGLSKEEIENKLPEIVEFVDIGNYIDMPMRTYSSGMKARLAFGILSFVQPEILIIDEALGVGDAGFAIKSGERLREMCNEGKVLILVTHAMEALRQMTTRCIWLDHGRIVQDGPTNAVVDAYQAFLRDKEETKLKEALRARIEKSAFHGKVEMSMVTTDVPGGAERLAFDAGSDVIFQMELRAKEPLSGLAVKLEIFTVDGTRVARFRYPDGGEGMALEKDETQQVSLCLPDCGLSEGVYETLCSVYVGSELAAQQRQALEIFVKRASMLSAALFSTPSTMQIHRKE